MATKEELIERTGRTVEIARIFRVRLRVVRRWLRDGCISSNDAAQALLEAGLTDDEVERVLDDLDQLLSSAEVRRILALADTTLDEWTDGGLIRCASVVRASGRRFRRYLRSSVLDILCRGGLTMEQATRVIAGADALVRAHVVVAAHKSGVVAVRLPTGRWRYLGSTVAST